MPPRLAKNARGKTAPPIKKPEGAADPTKDPQYLAPKDQPLLAQVFTQYEDKKYAASVKSADLLLKKYPQNAQTLCMKGLSTYNLGKREEGRAIAKQGLALDVKSHVCWHVSALIHRADREYEEALKCYVQGSRIEPNDLNILRDKINLQLFLRKYSDACESRLVLLRLQPRLRYSWTALAVAHHFAGHYSEASEMLQTYTDMLESIPAGDFDYSEVVMYKIQVFLEAGQPEKALEVLEKEGKKVVDLQGKKEATALIQKRLGKTKAAELAYGDLLQDNPDSKDYLLEYLSCRDIELGSLDDSNRQNAVAALSGLSDRFPRSRTVRRTVLDVATEETFRKRLSTYIVDGLTKGIPSLFSDLKRLLEDERKREIMLHVLHQMKDAMEAGKTIDGDEADTSSEEAPTTYIWLLYLLAQVQLHLRSLESALNTISLAISHTPVLPELWMTKARILKRSGDYYAAEEAMATARGLDGQDRFLNAKHVKYLLRIEEVEKAEEIAGLFTRKDAISPLADLTDMQCMWFLLAEAESFERQGNLGMALKRYHTIEKTFAEIYEDEFEFHSYCMRKFTLRACVNMARSNDLLRKHPAFVKAAHGAINIYLSLDAKPYEKPAVNGKHDANGIDDEERRKAEKKAKKAEAKAKAAAEDAKKGAAEETAVKELVDEDPQGEKLWSTRSALKDLTPFLVQLERLGDDSTEAQEMIFEVALRNKQYLRALKALRRFHAISPDSPVLHQQIVRFAVFVQSSSADLPESMRSIIMKELDSIIPLSSTSPSAFSNDYLQKHPSDADAVLAAAKAQWAISQDKSAVAELAMQVARQENKPTLATIVATLAFLRNEVQLEDERITEFTEATKMAYPNATALKTKEQCQSQKKALEESRRIQKEAGNDDVQP